MPEPIKMTRAEYETKYGQAPNIPTIKKEEPLSLTERARLSFGGEKEIAELKRREEEAGLRGKFDVGDIFDITGSAIPFITSTAGGLIGSTLPGIGTAAGIAGGTALGEIAKRALGHAFGVREEKTLGEEALGVIGQTALSYGIAKGADLAFRGLTKILPEKLMSTIFKQSADDIGLEIKTGGKNMTQAQEVLEEGFKGTPKEMMTKSWETMKTLEQQAQKLVSGQKVIIQNKQGYINLISDYITNLKKTSFGFENEIANEGRQIIQGLKNSFGNQIDGQLALQTRRFIDGVRRTSSFKLNPSLTPKEAAYKKGADLLRKSLATQIQGFGEIMKRYSIHINAFDDLAKYAARTANKEIFDLIDVFIMYGIDPTAYLTRRGLMSAPLKTGVAQFLHKGGQFLEQKITPKIVRAGTQAITKGVTELFEED